MDMITLTLGALPKTQLEVGACLKHSQGVDERWRDLWNGSLRSDTEQHVHSLVNKLRPTCRNLIVIGIGGSSLGLKAIHHALLGRNWNLVPHDQRDGPCLFVLDNVDPTTIASTYSIVKLNDPTLEHTVVCVISKSGETVEIAANLMLAVQQLQQATFVAITGKTGSLRNYAEEKGWDTLLVPDGVGGRFSVLSAVGLFPAAMCGVNIAEILDGAHAMALTCHTADENLAASLAAFLIGHTLEQRPIQIMMPYCDSLDNLAHWWVQLWAESLGKINKNNVRVGPTPIVAIGATDQHSVLQLWREGPTDKVIGFVGIEKGEDLDLGTEAISDTISWLCGKTIREVLHAEQHATTQAVSAADQPTWTLTIPHVDAGTIGQFFALWEITTAIAGRLLQVNPYDQPGVELGKQLTVEKLQNN